MNSLHDIQCAFKRSVLSNDTEMTPHLVEGGIPASQRMQIYRNNARIGFHAALAATYPVIEKLGGRDWFRHSAREYQLRYPSTCGDLQYVGERYPLFLQETLQATDYAYFTDVARLEWAYQEVLIAAETSPLDPASLAQVTEAQYEKLIFKPRAALQLVRSPFPILDIWKAHQPESGIMSRDIRFDGAPSNILLIRRNDHVEMRELAEADFILLQQFMQGVRLGHAAESVTVAEFDLGASLQHLVLMKTIAEFRIDSEDESE